jgi:3-oxoacyl-[acyl-carrier-protein] synthase II
MARKVVITGLGATTPIGGDVPTMWKNALKGVSGARTLEDDWVARYELPVTFACRASNKPDEVLTRVEAKRMDPSTQFAVVASREAWKDSGIEEIDHDRLAVAFLATPLAYFYPPPGRAPGCNWARPPTLAFFAPHPWRE